jgi:hypothetical protein
MQFTTTSNPNYSGTFAFAAMVGTDDATEVAWVSKCPGEQVVVSNCVASGSSSINLSWAQNSGKSCALQPNTTYYLNVGPYPGRTCGSGGCNYLRNIYTNGQP